VQHKHVFPTAVDSQTFSFSRGDPRVIVAFFQFSLHHCSGRPMSVSLGRPHIWATSFLLTKTTRGHPLLSISLFTEPLDYRISPFIVTVSCVNKVHTRHENGHSPSKGMYSMKRTSRGFFSVSATKSSSSSSLRPRITTQFTCRGRQRATAGPRVRSPIKKGFSLCRLHAQCHEEPQSAVMSGALIHHLLWAKRRHVEEVH